MGFGEAIRLCFQKYVDFTGRARRSEYWWFLLLSIVAGIAAGILDATVFPGLAARNAGPIGALVSLGLLLPSLAVFVRRLHDLDRTGWWVLFFYGALIVLSGCAIGSAFAGAPLAMLLFLALVVVLAVWTIVWMATRGTPGPNRYGPDPLASDAASAPAIAA